MIFLDEFVELFKMKPKENEFNSSFLMLGIDSNGIMCTSIFGHVTDYHIKKNICESARYCTIGGSIDGNIINEIYKRNILNPTIPIHERPRNTVSEVSRLDSTVNDNCYFQIIQRWHQ
jgi:hypothetical protein